MRRNGFLKILLTTASLLILKCSILNAQSDSLRHQIGIGVWPTYISYPYINIDFKTYFKKRTFYDFSIEGFYISNNNGNNLDDDYRYDLAASASVGVYFNFFKICRFNMAAQLTGFYARQKSINENSSLPYDYGRSREGVFVGPEFSLEVRVIRFNSSQIALFSKIHSGFGLMHEESYNNGLTNPYNTNDTYKEWGGSIAVGISYRFK